MATGDDRGRPPSDESIPGFETGDEEGLDTAGAPAVASAPGKFFLILFLGVAALFFVIYYVMLSGDKKADTSDRRVNRIAAPEPGEPPAPPAPVPLPPPQPIEPDAAGAPPPPTIPIITDKEPTDDNYLERLRSDMLVFNSSSGIAAAFGGQEKDEDAFAAHDPNSAFAQKAIRASKAEVAKAGRIGDLGSTIAQGKLIHGTLETAINTELPGTLRAIVSRDIYAETGKARLVPKGSRLIGVYNTDTFRGQSRVFVIWTRIIRPDGVDVLVGSPGVDALGRAGLAGFADGRFREMFATAILTSLVTIGVAKGAETVLGDQNTTSTQNTDGSTSTSGSATGQATAKSIGNIGGVAERVIGGIIDTRPVITVDHGTKINVMVNRDLIFPPAVLQQTNFVE